jgi:hypothetical protein
MEYLTTTYGLTGEHDPTSENGQLFLADYILLMNLKNANPEQISHANDIMRVQLSKSNAGGMGEYGLYHRNPELTTKTMSHDNLSAIFAWSCLNETYHRFHIWEYLLLNFGTYDNTKGVSKQFSKYLPFNPSNFFAWGLSADSVLAYLFFPFFLINLIISCNKPKNDVSGKILAFVEMYPLKGNPLVNLCYKYYTKKMKQQYGENYHYEIRKIYHGVNSGEFPINKLLGINNA